MTRNLEQELQQAYIDLNITTTQQNSFTPFLKMIKEKDVPTYEHEIRVGLKGIEVAKFTHIIEPKALFYSGLLHDTGKATIETSLLSKTEEFTEKDMQKMHSHVIEGWKILKDIHPFSANVLLYHHWFQGERSYPTILPKLSLDISRGTEILIAHCGRILAINDFYDASTYRKNKKFTDGKETRLKTPEEVKKLMLAYNQDQTRLITELYEAGIFGKDH